MTEKAEAQGLEFGASVFKIAAVERIDKTKNQSGNSNSHIGKDNSQDRKPHLDGQEDQKPKWNARSMRSYWKWDGRFGQGLWWLSRMAEVRCGRDTGGLSSGTTPPQ